MCDLDVCEVFVQGRRAGNGSDDLHDGDGKSASGPRRHHGPINSVATTASPPHDSDNCTPGLHHLCITPEPTNTVPVPTLLCCTSSCYSATPSLCLTLHVLLVSLPLRLWTVYGHCVNALGCTSDCLCWGVGTTWGVRQRFQGVHRISLCWGCDQKKSKLLL